MLGSTLGLLHNGVHDNTVPNDAQKADNAKDDRKDGTTVKSTIFSWRPKKEGTAVKCGNTTN